MTRNPRNSAFAEEIEWSFAQQTVTNQVDDRLLRKAALVLLIENRITPVACN